MMRECKCIVSLSALQDGRPYRERFVTQAVCTDAALLRVKDFVRGNMGKLEEVKVEFVDWLPFDSEMKLDIPPTLDTSSWEADMAKYGKVAARA
jgi:hypothetical protein